MNATFRSLRCVVALSALAAVLVLASAGTARANLIGHWTFDDPVGPYDDSSGYGSHGTPSGTPAQDTGLVGSGALRLNGASHLNVGSASVFDAETYTVSAWLNTDDVTNWRTAVGTWFSPSSQWMHFGLDNARRASNYVFVDGAVHGITDTATVVQPGQWYHMASVVDKANQSLQFWVNGQKTVDISLPTWTTTHTPGAQNVYIGTKDGAGNLWSGLIDDVRIYDQALDGAQIEQVMQQARQVPSPPAGLVSYWSFENSLQDGAGAYAAHAGGWKDDLAANSGTAQFVPGRVGNALRMNVQAGDVDYVSEGITADVKLHSSYTIEAWINPSTTAGEWQRVFLNWGGGQNSYHFAIHNDQVSIYHNEADNNLAIVEGSDPVQSGQWQHVAVVAQRNDADPANSAMTVYRNGVAVGTGTFDGTIFTPSTVGLTIGDAAAGPHVPHRYRGLIDEVAAWNTALSLDQVRTHFLRGAAGYGLAPGQAYDQVVLADNPVGYWRLGEPGGTTAHDSSPNTGVHNGTYTGAALGLPSGVRGARGNTAAYFDGNDYVNMGDIDALDGLAAVTAEAWVRWDGTPDTTGSLPGSIVRKQNPGGVFALGAGWDTPDRNAARFWVNIPGLGFVNSGDGTTNVADGEWHYVVGTYDGSFVRVYVDGVEESAAAYSGTLVSDNSPLWIGAYPGEAWTGMIDEVAVYARALSPGEITSHYQAGIVPEPGTLALAALGALGLLGYAWRRRRRAAGAATSP